MASIHILALLPAALPCALLPCRSRVSSVEMQPKTIIITSSAKKCRDGILYSSDRCVSDSSRGANLVGADDAVPEAGHSTRHGRCPVPSRRASRQCHDRVQVLVHLIRLSSLSRLLAFSRSLFWLQVNRAYPPAPVRPDLARVPALMLVARPVTCAAASNSRMRCDTVASGLLLVGSLFEILMHGGVRETLPHNCDQ
jgi:hypothetical protein